MSRDEGPPLPPGASRNQGSPVRAGEETPKLKNAPAAAAGRAASDDAADGVEPTLLPSALAPSPSSAGRVEPVSRRQWLRDAGRFTALGGIGALAGWLLYKQSAGYPRSGSTANCTALSASDCSQCPLASGCSFPQVWQIDPNHCIACGGCQTNCVLDISAVKAVNCFDLCGYCDVCTGFFPTADYVRNTGAENQLCPTGAITRKFIEKQSGVPYFEYTIDEQLCIACGKCVLGCRLMNGSLYLQVRHDRCLNCNECSIGAACPAQAFRRVPASSPQLLSRAAQAAAEAMARKREKHRGEKKA